MICDSKMEGSNQLLKFVTIRKYYFFPYTDNTSSVWFEFLYQQSHESEAVSVWDRVLDSFKYGDWIYKK